MVRRTSRRDHVEPWIERFVVGEQDDESIWPEFLDGVDAVIHNSVDWKAIDAGDLDRHLRSNLAGSIKLLKASAPRPFVYISSIAVHHDMRPRWSGVIDEDHPLRPGSLYGALKAAVEPHLWAEHAATGRHVAAIRPCGVYGIDPQLDRSHGYALVKKIRAGEALSKPGGGKFVHVDDVAAATVAALSNPAAAGRPFNMVDCYARWADWALMACEILGVEASIDMSSPAQPKNMFTKDAVQELGVRMERGHEGIREYLRRLIALMG